MIWRKRQRIRKTTICLRSHEKSCLINFQEHLFEPKYSRKKAVYDGLRPHFKTDEETKLFFDINFERKRRNILCRRIRMTQKANLQDFNYVDAVGKNGKAIREYVANQLKKDKEADQLSIFDSRDPLTGSK